MSSFAQRRDWRVADLSLAPFGRKEIHLAEHEMPGLERLTDVAAARVVFPQLDAGEDGRQQDKHQPVQGDRGAAVGSGRSWDGGLVGCHRRPFSRH